MSILISVHELTKGFAARPLFDGLTFAIETGERIGLIGPNGAGKSTLLRILASQATPDSGSVSLQKGLRVGFLEQVPSFRDGLVIQEAVMEGAHDPYDWECMALADEIMSKLSLSGTSPRVTPETPVAKLSGGWKKRVALARELVRKPDLLLLDEPTNHLDVESILWLEDFIHDAPFATMTITHDRAFLQRIANRIIELDRRNPGGLLSINGEYADYLETKELLMSAQEKRETTMKNTLRRETEWLRQGAKARTTKQQARINRAGDLKDAVSELEYRNQVKTARIDFQEAEKSPKRLVEGRGIVKSFSERRVFGPLDILLTPGTRIGLMGPNGCGKSTLIRVLLKEMEPDRGEVRHSDLLKVSYFEQNRDSLDPNLTVVKTLCPSGEYVDFRGGRVHIRSYLDRFLFSTGQHQMTVSKLSGGEQSRLLLAKLMLNEANLLVLDEPTNDLDVATLNVLQDCLTDFQGAVLLVTHDRYFLDQVATRLLAFDPFSGENGPISGTVTAFANLEQWENWHQSRLNEEKSAQKKGVPSAATVASTAPAKKKKLSYKEQRELDTMEVTLHAAEKEVARLTLESESPALATDARRLAEVMELLSDAHTQVERLYRRWSELTGE